VNNDQINPSVAGLNDGGFVVIWQSEGQDGSGAGIYGQRYNQDGNRVGSEFHVNTYTNSDQGYPSVTALNDGGFVVIWESSGQDGSGAGTYGRRYNSSGIGGGEFPIDTYTTSKRY